MIATCGSNPRWLSTASALF